MFTAREPILSVERGVVLRAAGPEDENLEDEDWDELEDDELDDDDLDDEEIEDWGDDDSEEA